MSSDFSSRFSLKILTQSPLLHENLCSLYFILKFLSFQDHVRAVQPPGADGQGSVESGEGILIIKTNYLKNIN